MRIALIEPYFAGSHRAWAEGYAAHSAHEVVLLTLPGRHWKWRMHGGAVSLARKFEALEPPPDLVLATDMLDLSGFLGLTRYTGPVAVYFHENQFAYPWAPGDPDPKSGRDGHFQFINYATALAADRVFYNSAFNRDSFLGALPGFLRGMPDHRELATVEEIAAKSELMPLGLDLARLDPHRLAREDGPPLILWNHRWEYDKDPASFFEALRSVLDLPWQLAVLGQDFGGRSEVFEAARQEFSSRIVQWGHVDSGAMYAQWLWRADILPVTSRQDFFGGSVVEAMVCETEVILPNRLAFPEHSVEDVYYQDAQDLRARLRRALQSPDVDLRQRLRQEVLRMDWGLVAPEMDRRFLKLTA